MTSPESPSPEAGTATAAYPNAGETGRLRGGWLRLFRTIAESVGVQGPTAGVVIAAAILASISGGGTALVQIIAAVAMVFVAYALGELINFGAVVSAFGVALAAIGASRILFTLGRDAGPGILHRNSHVPAPPWALIWVGAGSLFTLLVVIKEPLATRTVTISLTYGADLIIAAYILLVAAAILFTVRRRMSPLAVRWVCR